MLRGQETAQTNAKATALQTLTDTRTRGLMKGKSGTLGVKWYPKKPFPNGGRRVAKFGERRDNLGERPPERTVRGAINGEGAVIGRGPFPKKGRLRNKKGAPMNTSERNGERRGEG